MNTLKTNFRPTVLSQSLAAILICGSLLAPAAHAARINIPAGSLDQAIQLLARQAGIVIAADGKYTRQVSVAAISGELSAGQALQQLLRGSTLEAVQQKDGSYLLRPVAELPAVKVSATAPAAANLGAASSKEAQLPTVRVSAAANTGGSEGRGYVAKRSATATKTDTPIIETSQSIHTVSSEQIENQGVQRISQALRYTPGVSADMRGDTSRFDTLAFRGIGGVTDTAQYLDGLRLPRGVSYLVPQMEVHGVERLDVLKGPASIMYGQAPLGGIINMTSKRPTDEAFNELGLTAGSKHFRQIAWDSSNALNDDDTLRYRLVALAKKSDTSVDFTREERIYVAPSIVWQPGADTSLTLLAMYQHDPYGGFYGVLPSKGSILPNPHGPIARNFFDGSPSFNDFDRKQTSIGYEFSHRLNEAWTFKQNMRYLQLDLQQSQVGTQLMLPDNRTLMRYAHWSEEDLKAINLDTRLHGLIRTGAAEHQLLFGLDLQHDQWRQTTGLGRAPTLDLFAPNYEQIIAKPAALSNPHRKQKLLGLYAQDQITLDDWHFTLGGRFDRADIRTDNPLRRSVAEQKLSELTWRAGALYRFDSGFAPYASYSTSFDPSTTTNPYGAPFKPTTGRQFEAGLKYQPASWNALFTMAAFDLTQQNVLTRDPASNLPNAKVQTGEINSRGLELEARVSPAKDFNVIAGMTVINPKVTRSNGVDLGKRPVAVAKTSASLWGDYRVTEGRFAGWTLGAGVRHVGSSYADEANLQKIPSYTTMDAMLRFDFKHLDPALRGMSFTLNVANLTDKVFYTCNAADFCNYGQGRTVMGSLTYGW